VWAFKVSNQIYAGIKNLPMLKQTAGFINQAHKAAFHRLPDAVVS